MSFEGNYHAALQRIVALERERDEAIRQRDAPEYMFQAAKRVRELETELADWQRMRNEAMAVATSNRARINELEAALKPLVRMWDGWDLGAATPVGRARDLLATLETCPICGASAGAHIVSCERWELLGTTAETLSPARSHPSHKIRFSDAATYDEICELCGYTDSGPEETYRLSILCSKAETACEHRWVGVSGILTCNKCGKPCTEVEIACEHEWETLGVPEGAIRCKKCDKHDSSL